MLRLTILTLVAFPLGLCILLSGHFSTHAITGTAFWGMLTMSIGYLALATLCLQGICGDLAPELNILSALLTRRAAHTRAEQAAIIRQATATAARITSIARQAAAQELAQATVLKASIEAGHNLLLSAWAHHIEAEKGTHHLTPRIQK